MELAKQLADWKTTLHIPGLNWEDDATVGRKPQEHENNTTKLSFNGVSYDMIDPRLLLTANLQTRYKLILYLIHRPYIYKVLHEKDMIQSDDLRGCEAAFHVGVIQIVYLKS